MGKTATTWELMKSSWRVLMRDKALLLFPVISGVACLLVLLTFILPAVGIFHGGMAAVARSTSVLGYVLLFCYYVCNFFVIFFFNAALVAYVVERIKGGEPTLGGSLREAAACAPQIAAWAIVASTIGLVFKILESRLGLLARIVIAIVGVAWALVTYFVVPLIVIERKGAIEAIGASKDLLTRTWGKQLVSGLGYGLIGFLLTIPAIAIIVIAIVGAIASGVQHLGLLFYGGFSLLAQAAVVYLIGLGIVLSALRAIFSTVLFLYARDGTVPEGFDAASLQGAMKPA
ncbi:MAG: DUF6159 family protein [Casimicrobiaceae bacterium]